MRLCRSLVVFALGGILADIGLAQELEFDLQSSRGIETSNDIQRRTMGTRPSTPNGSEVDWGGLIKAGADALDRGIREDQRRRQFDTYPEYRSVPQYREYQPMQNQPVIRNVRPSQPVVRSESPKKNALPVFELVPAKNSPMGFELANSQQVQQAAAGLDQQVNQESQEIKQLQDQKIQDKLAEALETSPTATILDGKKLADAVKNSNQEAIQKIAKDLNLNPQKVKELMHETQIGQSTDQLAQLVQGGGSATQIQQATSVLNAQIGSGPPSVGSAELSKKLQSLSAVADGRDALVSALGNSSGGIVTSPTGTVQVISMPGMPQGMVAVTPGGQVIMGTGGQGAVQAGEVAASDVFGMAVPAGEPVPEDDGKIETGTVIRSPKDLGGDVNYTINGHRYSIKPGYAQRLGDGKWVVEFDRGGDFGTTQYSLQSGTYEFSVSEKGWDLSRKTYRITIDNSTNQNPFLYVLNGKQETTAARSTADHESAYPMLLSFDRGDGGAVTKKKLSGGVYQVGLDWEHRRIELYPAESVARATPKSPPSTLSKAWTGIQVPAGFPVPEGVK